MKRKAPFNHQHRKIELTVLLQNRGCACNTVCPTLRNGGLDQRGGKTKENPKKKNIARGTESLKKSGTSAVGP